LVQAPKRRPLVFNEAFEVLEAAGRVALKPGGDVIPIAEFGFKLADGERVALARRGPLFHDVRASFGEIGQVLLDRVRRLTGSLRVRECGCEAISVWKHVSLATILVQAAAGRSPLSALARAFV